MCVDVRVYVCVKEAYKSDIQFVNQPKPTEKTNVE